MNYLIPILIVAGVIAGSLIFYVAVLAIRTWLQLQTLEKKGIQTTARILHAEILNGPDRYIPFVRMQVEVITADGNCFITEAASFFSKHQLTALQFNELISIRYNPQNVLQVQVIKEPTPQEIKVHAWQPLIRELSYNWLN